MPAGMVGNLSMQGLLNYKVHKDALPVFSTQVGCLLTIFAFGLALDNTSTLSNLYVPDGIGYLNEAVRNAQAGNLRQIIDEAPTSALLILFNTVVFTVSPLLFPLVNALLL